MKSIYKINMINNFKKDINGLLDVTKRTYIETVNDIQGIKLK
jgi:hypothetical protein